MSLRKREFNQGIFLDFLCALSLQDAEIMALHISAIHLQTLIKYGIHCFPLPFTGKKKKNLFCYFSIKNILAAKNKRVIPKAIEMINFAMFKINVRHPPPKKNCYLLLYSCKASMMS